MSNLKQSGRRAMLIVTLAVATSGAYADNWGGEDKAKHIAVGAVVGLAGMGIQKADDPDRFRNSLWAGAALGALKELRDEACKCGDPSVKDFLATTLGAAIGASAGLLIFPEKNGVSVQMHKAF